MSPASLLIVDDEPEILELLAMTFEDYEVRTALNTDSALELLRDRACDVLITDIKMPGRSGLVLIGRALEALPALPVIVISGHQCEARELEKTQIFRWINKPFRRQQIREAVEQALRKNRH